MSSTETASRISWVDHMIARLETSRFPLWPSVLVLGGAAYLGFSWIQWTGGAYSFGTFNLFHAVFVLELFYLVVLMKVLNDWAEMAFDEYEPVLLGSEAERESLKEKLLFSPAWPTLAASVIPSAAFVSFLYLMLGQGFYYGAGAIELVQAADTPLSVGAFVVISAIRWFFYGGFGYHIYHQLATISEIYSDWTRINLWNTRPLYAFSRHTARTALAVIVTPYLWFVTGADLSQTGFSMAVSFMFAGLAVMIFILPLRGVHAVLEHEKDNQIAKLAQRLEDLKTRLDRAVTGEDLASVDGIVRAIDSYQGLRTNLEAVATWPWQPGTFRNLLGALMIPLVIWMLQQILNRYFPF